MIYLVQNFFYRLITVSFVRGCAAGYHLIIYIVIRQELKDAADGIDVGADVIPHPSLSP